MTATQIQEALLQAPASERLPLAAKLIALYHAELDAEESRQRLARIEAKVGRR
jgi:hypothetical protein